MKVIMLAAGVGNRLKNFTHDPKCLIKINDETLIVRNIELLKKAGMNDIVIVTGYKADRITALLKRLRIKAEIITNINFSEGSVVSLWCARETLRDDCLIMDADLYFEKAVLERISCSKKKNFFLIDSGVKDDAEAVMVGFRNGRAVALGRGMSGEYDLLGEWAGFLKLSGRNGRVLEKILEEKCHKGGRSSGYEFVISGMFEKAPISYELVNGLKWVEIDFSEDVKKAERLNIAAGRASL